jgi:hypothetical protein
MPRVTWPLLNDRPTVCVTLAAGTQQAARYLLADTGAGSALSVFDLILNENDCLGYGILQSTVINLLGAYSGPFSIYLIRVRIPQLAFDHNLRVAAVQNSPDGFSGIACFPFLQRFTYGNFGNPAQFGLEL